jgi:hypothetical protein
MATNKTPVRLEPKTVRILKAIQKSTSVRVSLASLANLIIRTAGPSFRVK